MVVVQVEWLEGRNPEQKEALVVETTNALKRTGAQQENVYVVLHEVPPSNWGLAGELVEPPQEVPRERPAGDVTAGTETPDGRKEAPIARATSPELDGGTRVFDLEQPREEDMPPAMVPG